MTTPPSNSGSLSHPFRAEGNLGFEDFSRLKEYGQAVQLPADAADLHTLALEVICSRGVPCYLTPYGAVRSVAAFAIGATDDAFYRDGQVLLKAAVRARDEGHHAA